MYDGRRANPFLNLEVIRIFKIFTHNTRERSESEKNKLKGHRHDW